jgi:hypothetical protein
MFKVIAHTPADYNNYTVHYEDEIYEDVKSNLQNPDFVVIGLKGVILREEVVNKTIFEIKDAPQ